jgi:hypothetical protein
MGLPVIDEHEAQNLEMMFSGATDRQLIRELVRRKRLHVADASEVYYTELAADERYMAGVNFSLARRLTEHLIDQGHVLFQETGPTADPRLMRKARHGSLVVLRERGAKPDGL